MSRKNNLRQFKNVDAGDMSDDIISEVTNIQFLDNIGIQLNFTGTPTGTFEVQVSADFVKDPEGRVVDAGHWIPINLPTTPVASGADGQIYIDITQISAPWIRVVYSRSGGSGSLDGFITAKMI